MCLKEFLDTNMANERKFNGELGDRKRERNLYRNRKRKKKRRKENVCVCMCARTRVCVWCLCEFSTFFTECLHRRQIHKYFECESTGNVHIFKPTQINSVLAFQMSSRGT